VKSLSESPDDIEAIKQRKLARMQRRMADEENADQAKKEVDAQKQSILRLILTPEARSRLNNLKMVRPDFADQLEMQLIELAEQRRLPVPLTDDQLKNILTGLQGKKRDITITRI